MAAIRSGSIPGLYLCRHGGCLRIQLGSPLAAGKLRVDGEGKLYLCTGNRPNCQVDFIQKMVFNPACYEKVWHANFQVSTGKCQLGRVFKPDSKLLRPYLLGKSFVDSTYLGRVPICDVLQMGSRRCCTRTLIRDCALH
ncbi:hypothetical protein ES703_26185 [subsurface metagenome]